MTLPRPLHLRWRQEIASRLRRRGKQAFLKSLPPGARVLDIGCGNNSPRDAKVLRPDIAYIGLDVGDYNQQGSLQYADVYTVVPPAEFAAGIRVHAGTMDAVVSSHNLEHCNDPQAVLDAMAGALRPGGQLFLAFPCEASVGFPKRGGCLNFFDDPTHRAVPQWQAVTSGLQSSGLTFIYACRRYRPALLAALGLVLEPLAWLLRRNMPGSSTWALYGFESLIWARQERQDQLPAPRPAPADPWI